MKTCCGPVVRERQRCRGGHLCVTEGQSDALELSLELLGYAGHHRKDGIREVVGDLALDGVAFDGTEGCSLPWDLYVALSILRHLDGLDYWQGV